MLQQAALPQANEAREKAPQGKKEATGGEKPETVRTHLRNMVIVPEMIGSVVGVYNGKVFNTVEIKPEMVGTTSVNIPSPTDLCPTAVPVLLVENSFLLSNLCLHFQPK